MANGERRSRRERRDPLHSPFATRHSPAEREQGRVGCAGLVPNSASLDRSNNAARRTRPFAIVASSAPSPGMFHPGRRLGRRRAWTSTFVPGPGGRCSFRRLRVLDSPSNASRSIASLTFNKARHASRTSRVRDACIVGACGAGRIDCGRGVGIQRVGRRSAWIVGRAILLMRTLSRSAGEGRVRGRRRAIKQ